MAAAPIALALAACARTQTTPSGVATLLSAVDLAVVAVDRAGVLLALHRLDGDLLPQPEGLCFPSNGDLVITSEGGDGPARACVFTTRR